jgi:hypothetical protein
MRSKWFLSSTLGMMLFFFAIQAFSQVVPAGHEGNLPFAVGAGPSSFDVDWGHGRMLGGTIWADYHPNQLPSLLHGLGLELEARDISLNANSTQKNYREDTVAGGAIYTWYHYRNFHPYGKFLVGYGSMDFSLPPPNANYSHDTRTLYAPGLGLEQRLFRHVWARADYEYQTWPDFLSRSKSNPTSPNPQGFTLGVAYDFGHIAHRK